MTSTITDGSRASALPPCICGGSAYVRVHGPYRYPASHQAPGQPATFEVHKCRRCALARTAPPPFADDLTADIHQELAYEEVTTREAQWRRYFQPVLDAARRHVPRGKLLDVGCGVGLAVRMAQEAGYEAHGVEINERSAAYGRDVLGLDVRTSDLAGAGYPEGHFDVVLLSHVLEHLVSPADVLHDIRRVLKPEGVLVVEVPNMAGLQVGLLGEKWAGWAPYMHVWQFTPATLVATLAANGFASMEVRARDNMDVGTPLGVVKRVLRNTLYRAVEVAAEVSGRSDKVLSVARPIPGFDR